MTRAAIVGGGAFGTAMACVLRRSGCEVILWAREREVAEAVHRDRINPVFLPEVRLPLGIDATCILEAVVADADFVLMAVPAQHVRGIAAALRPVLRRGMPVVSCSKGVEIGSLKLMPEVLADMLPEAAIAVLSGPSFAREIAQDLPCGVVLASHEWSTAEALAQRIANPNFCVHLSDDVTGAALAGAMKNVISIAAGIVHGRKLGENAAATLVTRGLAEAQRLGVAKGARAETFAGLAGAGDFMLTAHSLQSRNTKLGVELGEGRKLGDILAGRKQVTEGAFTTEAVAALARELHVSMPIVQGLDQLLNRGATVDEAIGNFMRHLPALCRVGEPTANAVTA